MLYFLHLTLYFLYLTPRPSPHLHILIKYTSSNSTVESYRIIMIFYKINSEYIGVLFMDIIYGFSIVHSLVSYGDLFLVH